MTMLQEELALLGVPDAAARILREKDGVTVARVECGGASYICKCFAREEHRREIANYALLARLGVPTLRVAATARRSILLEDLETSGAWRLAREDDLGDERTVRALARWYRTLHDAGRAWVAANGADLYDESDRFTRETLARLRLLPGAADLPVWSALDARFGDVRRLLDETPRALAYNDFDWSNMAVARDGSAALMFDYNFLGKGYVWGDLCNAAWPLTPALRAAFLDEYGPHDPREELLHRVVSPIVTLSLAAERPVFPSWGRGALALLRDDVPRALEELFSN